MPVPSAHAPIITSGQKAVTATTLRVVGVKVEPLEVPAAECVRRLNRDARRAALAGSCSRLVERRWRDYTGRDGDEMVHGVGGMQIPTFPVHRDRMPMVFVWPRN